MTRTHDPAEAPHADGGAVRPGAVGPRPTVPQRFDRNMLIAICASSALAVLLTLGLSWLMQSQTADIWGFFTTLPIIIALSVPVLGVLLRHEPDAWIRRLCWVFLASKVVMAILRWLLGVVVYSGTDADFYDSDARWMLQLWGEGEFITANSRTSGGVSGSKGTSFAVVATALVYKVFGHSVLGGFLVFSWLSFIGVMMLYVAFRRGLPTGDHRRYAVLLFFVPSLMFWPAGLTKEALMLLFVGMGALGTVKMLHHEWFSGVPLVAIGALLAAGLRPYFAGFILAGTVCAFIARRSGAGQSRKRRRTTLAVKIGLLALMGIGGMWAVQQFVGFVDDSSAASANNAEEALQAVQQRTMRGESSFTPHIVKGPLDLPQAAITVLFRPFLHEAKGINMLITSLEGTALMVLTALAVWQWRRLWTMTRDYPYIAFCLVYTTAFIVAFSYFGNFGMLVRQRTLTMPMFFALLCLIPKPDVRLLGGASRRLRPNPLQRRAVPSP